MESPSARGTEHRQPPRPAKTGDHQPATPESLEGGWLDEVARPKGKVLSGDPLDHVADPADRDLVADAFAGPPVAVELGVDLTVYRYRGGHAKRNAAWLSPARYPSARAARRELALPASNTAEHEDVFVIPGP